MSDEDSTTPAPVDLVAVREHVRAFYEDREGLDCNADMDLARWAVADVEPLADEVEHLRAMVKAAGELRVTWNATWGCWVVDAADLREALELPAPQEVD